MSKKLKSFIRQEGYHYLNLISLLTEGKLVANSLYKESAKEKNTVYATNNFQSLGFYKNILQNIDETDYDEMDIIDSRTGYKK